MRQLLLLCAVVGAGVTSATTPYEGYSYCGQEASDLVFALPAASEVQWARAIDGGSYSLPSPDANCDGFAGVLGINDPVGLWSSAWSASSDSAFCDGNAGCQGEVDVVQAEVQPLMAQRAWTPQYTWADDTMVGDVRCRGLEGTWPNFQHNTMYVTNTATWRTQRGVNNSGTNWSWHTTNWGSQSAAEDSLANHFANDCPLPTYEGWITGDYRHRSKTGQVWALAQPEFGAALVSLVAGYQAYVDRQELGGLAEGLTLDGYEFPAGGTPGGGTTGPYCADGSTPDPETGLCADGSVPYDDRPEDWMCGCWVLDIPCNLRCLFLPDVGLSGGIEGVRVAASTRAPFSWDVTGWVEQVGHVYLYGTESGEDYAFDPATECPTWNAGGLYDEMRINYPALPSVALGDTAFGYNLCTSAPVVWMHEHGRRIALLFMYVAFLLFIVRRVVARGGS